MEEFTDNRENNSQKQKKNESSRKRRYSSSSSPSRSRSRSRDHRSSQKKSSHRQASKRYRRSRSRSRRNYDCRRSFSRSPSYHRRTRYYGTRENPYKSRVLGVFGLSSMTNEGKLTDVFSKFGTIEHISIIYDAKTGNSRGFGFIYYKEIQEATNARVECNGSTMDGKRIRVDYSITKRAHTPTPGVYMGSRSPKERNPSRNSSRRRSSRHHNHSRSRTRSRSQSYSRKSYR